MSVRQRTLMQRKKKVLTILTLISALLFIEFFYRQMKAWGFPYWLPWSGIIGLVLLYVVILVLILSEKEKQK